jgi:hypothetical protein
VQVELVRVQELDLGACTTASGRAGTCPLAWARMLLRGFRRVARAAWERKTVRWRVRRPGLLGETLYQSPVGEAQVALVTRETASRAT